MSNENDLATAIANNFESSDRKALNEFAKQMEVKVTPKDGDAAVRKALLTRLGKATEEPESLDLDNPAKIDALKANQENDIDEQKIKVLDTGMSKPDLLALMRLNLAPGGIWQGRRRIVQITKPEGMKGQQPHPFTWAGHQVLVPWGVTCTVPYPVYNIIKGAKHKEIVQRRTQDSKGTPIVVNEFITVDRFRMADAGDDPATKRLPVGQKQQFQIIATNLNHFEKTPRRTLAKICKRVRVKYPRDTETEEIRYLLLEKLGFDTDELFGESGDELV